MRGSDEFDWTDDAVAALRKHHGAGLSAGMIMRKLGCKSRNTVIGKINRLGLRRDLNGGAHVCLKAGGIGAKPRNSAWTEQMLAEFHRLYAEHRGDGSIAAALGAPFTRKMVQGKRKSLGLSSHFASPATRKAARPAPKPEARIKLKSDGTIASYFAPTQPRLRTEPIDAQPIRVTIADLTPSSCRWPLGDPSDLDTFRYCGAQTTDQKRATAASVPGGESPYCAGHHRLAYNGARG